VDSLARSGLARVQVDGCSPAGCPTRETWMLTLSRGVVRWCMLKVPHGQKRKTHRRETRTRESAHRAAPAEGRASSRRERPEADAGIGQDGRRSGYCPHQAGPAAARRLAVRRQLGLAANSQLHNAQRPNRSLAGGPWELGIDASRLLVRGEAVQQARAARGHQVRLAAATRSVRGVP
jgi:hypothetical protein